MAIWNTPSGFEVDGIEEVLLTIRNLSGADTNGFLLNFFILFSRIHRSFSSNASPQVNQDEPSHIITYHHHCNSVVTP
jgi:hypothetical protein